MSDTVSLAEIKQALGIKDVDESAKALVDFYVEQLVNAEEAPPTGVESVELHKDRRRQMLKDQFREIGQDIVAGLAILAADEDRETAAIASRWQQAIGNSDALATAMAEDLPSAFAPFYKSAFALHDRDDLHRAKSACTVLIMAYPLEPHPYTLLGTILWRQAGLEAAVRYYDAIVQIMQHPMTNYFAADCFYTSGDRERAQALLEEGLELCTENPEYSAEYRDLIETFLTELRT